MGDFPYLWIYNNKEDQDENQDGLQLTTAQYQKGNLYVKNDIIMNGESIFTTYDKELNRIKNIFGKKHTLNVGVRPNGDWTVSSFTAELIGTHLHITFAAKTKKKLTVADLQSKNVDVVDVTIAHNGLIKNMCHVSFPNESSGPLSSFYTHGKGVNGKNLDFGVKLTSLGSDLKVNASVNAKFSIPVAINVNNYPVT